MNVPRIVENCQDALQAAQLDPARKVKRAFTLRGIVNGYTGYGLHTEQIVTQFMHWGYDIALRSVGEVDEHPPALLREALERRDESRPQVLLQPCSFLINRWVDYWFTMHETTTLSQEQVHMFSRANALIVPSHWNASCFHAQGISVPIYVCPLGFDPAYFYATPAGQRKCVFGVAGNPSLSVAYRKNLDMAITAFGLAFPCERDVELRVKVLPSCVLPSIIDARVRVEQAVFSTAELARWTQELTAFILPSRCEGWGLFALQAMACGRPVIAASFGGLTEFFNDLNGYSITFELVKPKKCFNEIGLWAEPNMDSLVEQMRQVYCNRDEAVRKGNIAHVCVENFTWEHSNRRLEDILFAHPLREAPDFRFSKRNVRLMRLGRRPRSAVFMCGMDDGHGFINNFQLLAVYSMRWKSAFVGNPKFNLVQRAVIGWTTDDFGLNRISHQNLEDDSEEYYAWLASLDCLIHLDCQLSGAVYDAITMGIPVISLINDGPFMNSIFTIQNEMDFVAVLRQVYWDKHEVQLRAQLGERLVL